MWPQHLFGRGKARAGVHAPLLMLADFICTRLNNGHHGTPAHWLLGPQTHPCAKGKQSLIQLFGCNALYWGCRGCKRRRTPGRRLCWMVHQPSEQMRDSSTVKLQLPEVFINNELPKIV